MPHTSVKFLLLICLGIFTWPASAASFDCAKAQSTNEKLICRVKNLSDLDETYARLYKLLRTNNRKSAQINAEAKAAWRWREANCNATACLQQWYVERILTLQNTAVTSTKPAFTLLDLYKRLNLTSIGKSSQVLSSVRSYPFNTFANSTISIESNDTLIFADDGNMSSIAILGGNKIRFSVWGQGMRPKYQKDGNIYELSFNEQYQDWRAINSDTVTTTDLTTPLIYRSRHEPADAYKHEPFSVGEFVLSSFTGPAHQTGCLVQVLGMSPDDTKLCELPPTPLYNKPGGNRSGSMRIALVRGRQTGSSDAEVWLLNERGLSIAEPILIVRRKEEIALLAFGSTKTKQNELGWLNISPNPSKPAWVNREDMYSNFNKIYSTREQVVSRSNDVILSSNHNLRVQPSTTSTVITVLEKNKGTVFPMNVEGDWMQVQYVNPRPPADWPYDTSIKLDSSYTQLQGWIKWRKHVGREYVSFSYWYD